MKETYKLKCPKCSKESVYYSRKGYFNARKNKTLCASCRGVKKKSPHFKIKNTEWVKRCPSCEKTQFYSSKRNLKRAVQTNSICSSCRGGPTKEHIKKIKITLSKKKYPHRKSNNKKNKIERFFRDCPICGKKIGYVGGYSFERAKKQNSMCNSCSSIVYKKSWKNVIKQNHINKMAAKKAGYDSYKEYLFNIDEKKNYQRKVKKLTRTQPINTLKNFDKLRGRCGINGAYQLDHIISISEGYRQKIPPEKIADISNLQIIPWKENLLKSNK